MNILFEYSICMYATFYSFLLVPSLISTLPLALPPTCKSSEIRICVCGGGETELNEDHLCDYGRDWA